MHTGKIKKIIRDRGFGFIADTDGRELFFHKTSLIDARFETLDSGQKVEFEVQKSKKGHCAVNVQITSPAEGNILE